MKRYIALFSLVSCLFFSCSNNSTESDTSTATDSTEHDHHGSEHSDQSTAVTLNNGAKWTANPETTEGIKSMQSLVDSLSANATLEEYHDLKTKLDVEFNGIIQKCTMTGEAHDQLHNYILPLKELIQQLGNDSLEECKESAENLKAHLAEYDKYFQ